jgi:PAS domain S-box-containing protein
MSDETKRSQLTNFLVEKSATAMLLVAADGSVYFVNPAASALLGYHETDLIGMGISDFMPELDSPSFSEYWERLRLSTQLVEQVELVHRDGGLIPAEISANFLVFDGVELSCSYIRDLREEKHLQAQLLQAQKLEAVGRLAGGIAHDFNNLLTIIGGYTDVLLDREEVTGIDRVALSEIRAASDRATDLTRQLLTFSRKQIVKPQIFDLNRVVGDMDRMIRRLIGEDIELRTILKTGLSPVMADLAQIEQVIMNLCVNARDAMPDGGSLTLETNELDVDSEYASHKPGVTPGRYVMLGVSDTGIGMDRDTQSRIFEPFFTTKSRDKGTGLGLSTVYGIVKRANGNVWVYSEPGKGTTFKVYLPNAAEEVIRSEEPPLNFTQLGGVETILVVEDDAHVRGLVVHELAALGYRVLAAGTPEDAMVLNRNHAGDIDLLLTDVVLPSVSGKIVAEEVTRDRPGIQVLYMSGYTDSAIAQHGVLEEGVNFIQKPFTRRALASKVREILSNFS